MAANVHAAARNALGVLEKLEGPDIKVYPNRCVEVRNRNAGCHACAEACAGGAISVVDGLLSVDAALCIGCGTCATVCPTCALEARHPDDEDLLARCLSALEAGGCAAVAVACAKVAEARFGRYDEGRLVEVACLGRVDESLIAALTEHGCERVVLVGHRCDECTHAAGARAAAAVCASAEALLEAWGAPIEITLTDDLPAFVLADGTASTGAASQVDFERLATPNQPCSTDTAINQNSVAGASASAAPAPQPGPGVCPGRSSAGGEDCLSTGANPGTPEVPQAEGEGDEAKRALPQKVGRDGTLPHHVPTRRGRLLASLDALGAPSETTVTSRLWGTVSIDTEACGSCRLCAVFCPTGALRKFDDRKANAFGIEHTPAKCVKCRCCADICPQGAVTITEEIFAPDIVDGHVERFEMRPREIEPGRPTTVVKRMRKLLSDSKFVNFA